MDGEDTIQGEGIIKDGHRGTEGVIVVQTEECCIKSEVMEGCIIIYFPSKNDFLKRFISDVQDTSTEVVSAEYVDDICYVIKSRELDSYQNMNKYITIYELEYKESENPDDMPEYITGDNLYACSLCCNINKSYDFWIYTIDLFRNFIESKEIEAQYLVYNDLNGEYSYLDRFKTANDIEMWVMGSRIP